MKNAVLKRFNKVPQKAKASFWYLFSQTLKKASGFIIVPVYTRLLSSSEYGKYSIFYSWYDVLLVFATLIIYGNGFYTGLTRFYDDKDRYVSSMLGLECAIFAFFSAIMILFKDSFAYLFDFPTTLLTLMLFELGTEAPYQIWAASQKYDYKYKLNISLAVIATIINPIIGIFLIKVLQMSFIGAILGKAIPAIILGLLSFGFILHDSHELYITRYWKYALMLNLPLIFYYLEHRVLNQTDKLMIRYFVDNSAVGVYSVAATAASIITVMSIAINNSLCPHIFQSLKNKCDGGIRDIVNFSLIVSAMFCLFIILIVPEMIRIFASDEFLEGVLIVGPLVIGLYFSILYQFYCDLEFYYERKFYLALVSILVCMFNLILNYILIPRFGYIVAAYTTLMSHVMSVFLHKIVVNKILKEYNLKSPYDEKTFLGISVMFVLAAFIFMRFYPYIVVRYCFLFLAFCMGIVKRHKIASYLKNVMEKMR